MQLREQALPVTCTNTSCQGGDANFFPIIAQTKAIPELLGDARAKLAAAWPVERPSNDEEIV